MDRGSGKEDDNPYRLLDLIPSERECFVRTEQGVAKRISSHGSSDDKKLELRLGLPGGDEEDENFNFWSKEKKGLKMGNYFPAPAPWGYVEEFSSSHLCCTTMVDLQQATTPPPPPATPDMKNNTFSPPSANPAVPNISQKRAAPAPVVGWPPIRSFRKNLANSSAAKLVQDPQTTNKSVEKKPTEKCQKGFFVKINMDGVPIGRKVDLSAYDSYAKLSSAVDSLFRGLLAAQREHCAGLIEKKQEETAITGLLDGSGEYTLVYEDTEGDRMLAGDVPWHMFVSTVKRLRVLKSSEVSSVYTKQGARGKGRMISNE